MWRALYEDGGKDSVGAVARDFHGEQASKHQNLGAAHGIPLSLTNLKRS